MIKISTQGYISEFGKRSNNEDNYGLNKGLTYVVCDGVGGAEKGEIASEITVRCFIEAFKENAYEDANIVLKQAEAELSEYVNEHPEAMGMATTLTFSQVRDNGIYVAWVGDSRIYQFRNGAIVFKTTDHSWVNEALEAGIIDAEEAINHPKSNIITRAVQGAHKPTLADTILLHDVQKGDLFFHCSDGVLESWDDESLQALFSSEHDPKIILDRIKNECAQYSKDNFTSIVYGIESAVFTNEKKDNAITSTLIEAIPLSHNEFVGTKNKPSFNGVLKVKVLGVPLYFFILLLAALLVIYFSFIKKEEPTPVRQDLPKKHKIAVKGSSGKEEAASVKTFNHDSLAKQGWDTIKPKELKMFEDSANGFRKKIREERNATKIQQLKNDLKNCELEISALKIDTFKINNKSYYKITGKSAFN